MKRIFDSITPADAEVSVDHGADTRIRALTKAMRDVYLQVFGIPYYERYLEHMALRHPGQPVLSRREFCACAIDRKYAGKGPRCC
jgi:uncharacterized short protein YbdD (DUF466 family)